MAYEMIVTTKPTHLHVTLTGTDSLRAAKEYWTQIALRLREGQERRLLMEERLTGRVPDGEIHEWGDFVRTLGLPPGMRIAFVHLAERSDEYRYVETLLMNRGFVSKVFARVADAEAWLLSGDVPQRPGRATD